MAERLIRDDDWVRRRRRRGAAKIELAQLATTLRHSAEQAGRELELQAPPAAEPVPLPLQRALAHTLGEQPPLLPAGRYALSHIRLEFVATTNERALAGARAGGGLRLFVPRRPGWIERRLQRLWRHFVPAPRARAVRVEIRVAPGTAPQTLIDGTSIEGEEKQDGYGQDREAAEGGSSGLL